MVDPRPDLTMDAALWKAVLMGAADDPDLFGQLHGLRCGGAKMVQRPNGTLKIIYQPLLTGWKEEELVANWLMPRRKKITRLFRQVRDLVN